MQRPIISLALLSLLTGCAEDSAQTGQGYTKLEVSPYTCAAGARLSIETDDKAFALQGPCDQIVIKGKGNRLTIATAKNIEVFGDNNLVEVDEVDRLRGHGKGNIIKYKTGIGGRKADVVTLGDNSPVHQVK